MTQLHVVAFRKATASIARRKTQRQLSRRAQLARQSTERLIAMIRLLETRLEEERAASNQWASSCQSLADHNQKLHDRIGEWDYISDVIRPCDIYEFLEEIGLNPYDLPSDLSNRLALRDFIAGLR